MPHACRAERFATALSLCLLVAMSATQAGAQNVGQAPAPSTPAARAAVLAVADSALAAISRGDMVGLTDLMLPDGVLFPSRTADGVTRARARSRADQRASPVTARITERGFRPEVRVDGPIATVWYPYDLYLDGKWSHCGVDVFVLFQSGTSWKIGSLSWSAVQPPACERHPDGPPAP
jgi:hypothetical protein